MYGGYPPTEGRRRRRSLEWWQPNPYNVRNLAYLALTENDQNSRRNRICEMRHVVYSADIRRAELADAVGR